MSVLKILGADAATQQGTKVRWQQGGGESKVYSYRGPSDKVREVYDLLVANSLTDPTLVVMDFDPGKGLGEIVFQRTDPEVVIGTSVVNGVTTLYELFANEFTKPVHQNAWFSGGDGALTVDQIVQVYSDFERRATGVSYTNDLQTQLYELLCKGTEEYFESGYVLRESKIVNGRNAVRANFTRINMVDAPPDAAAANTLIGALPEGEWLKKAPNIRQISKSKWHVETEWWWAEKWSKVLYDGTGSP